MKSQRALQMTTSVTLFALVTFLVTQSMAGELTDFVAKRFGPAIKSALNEPTLENNQGNSPQNGNEQPKPKTGLQAAIDTLSTSFSLRAISASLGAGAQFKLGLKGSVHPSYLRNYYTRQESLIPSFDFDLGKMFGETFLKIYVSPKLESSFYRRFNDSLDAYDFFGRRNPENKPYGLDHIPSDTRALQKLTDKDTYKYRNELEVFVAPLDKSAGHILSGSIQAGWIQGGALIMSISKLPLDHVELKVIAIKKKGPGYKYQGGIGSALGLGAHGFLLKAIATYINNRILRWNFTKTEQQGLADFNLPDMKYKIFIADYVLDLSDEETAQAYDRIVPQYFVYHDGKPSGIAAQKVLEIVNPLNQDLASVMESFNRDFEKLNELYYIDVKKEIPEGYRNVDRRIYAVQESHQDFNFERVGADFITYTQNSQMAAKDKIMILDDSNQYHQFDHYIAEKSFVKKESFGVRNQAEIKSVDALCTKGTSVNDCNMELGFHYELTASHLSPKDQNQFFDYLRDNLPEQIYESIPLGSWKNNAEKRNAYINSLILFKQGFADLIPPEAKNNLKGLFEDYLQRIKFDPVDREQIQALESPLNEDPSSQSKAIALTTASQEKYNVERNALTGELNILLDGTLPEATRMESLLRLKSNDLFKKYGAGFILNLISTYSPTSNLFVKVRMTAANADNVEFPLSAPKGQRVGAKIYEAFTTIQSQINRAINPQLQDEQLRLVPAL